MQWKATLTMLTLAVAVGVAPLSAQRRPPANPAVSSKTVDLNSVALRLNKEGVPADAAGIELRRFETNPYHVLAAMIHARYAVAEVTAVARKRFNMTAQNAWRMLTEAAKLAPETALGGVRTVYRWSASEASLALAPVTATVTVVGTTLQSAGYQAREIGQGLIDAGYDAVEIAQTMEAIGLDLMQTAAELRFLGVEARQAAAALNQSHGPILAAPLASALGAAGYTAEQSALALQHVGFNLLQSGAALRAAGYTAVSMGQGLLATGASLDAVGSVMLELGVALTDVATLLAAEGTDPEHAAALLFGLGASASETAAVLSADFSQAAEQVAGHLGASGYALGKVALAMRDQFDWEVAEWIWYQKHHGEAASAIEVAIQVWSASIESVGQAMLSAGYLVPEIIQPLAASFGMSVAAVGQVLASLAA